MTLALGNGIGIANRATCAGAMTAPRSSLERTNFEGSPLAAKFPEVDALVMKLCQCRAIESNAKWVVSIVGDGECFTNS